MVMSATPALQGAHAKTRTNNAVQLRRSLKMMLSASSPAASPTTREVDINFLIADTSKLLRPTLGEHVEI